LMKTFLVPVVRMGTPPAERPATSHKATCVGLSPMVCGGDAQSGATNCMATRGALVFLSLAAPWPRSGAILRFSLAEWDQDAGRCILLKRTCGLMASRATRGNHAS